MRSYDCISSTSNEVVKRVVKLATNTSYRKKEGVTIVEGKNVLRDLTSMKEAEALFLTNEHLQEALPCKRLYLVTEEVMKKISTVESPEGMLALFPIVESPIQELQFPCLILDGLQDPGNVGTLLRTASAFGIKHIAVIEPACDLWHPKVMRSAKGAQYFFSSLVRTTWKDLLPLLRIKKIPLFVATLHGAPLHTLSIPSSWALTIGSEGQGPTLVESEEHIPFTIPIHAQINSLNASQAGAIALYFFTR